MLSGWYRIAGSQGDSLRTLAHMVLGARARSSGGPIDVWAKLTRGRSRDWRKSSASRWIAGPQLRRNRLEVGVGSPWFPVPGIACTRARKERKEMLEIRKSCNARFPVPRGTTWPPAWMTTTTPPPAPKPVSRAAAEPIRPELVQLRLKITRAKQIAPAGFRGESLARVLDDLLAIAH